MHAVYALLNQEPSRIADVIYMRLCLPILHFSYYQNAGAVMQCKYEAVFPYTVRKIFIFVRQRSQIHKSAQEP